MELPSPDAPPPRGAAAAPQRVAHLPRQADGGGRGAAAHRGLPPAGLPAAGEPGQHSVDGLVSRPGRAAALRLSVFAAPAAYPGQGHDLSALSARPLML